MIQPERLTRLNAADTRPGRYVLCWMQQAQREMVATGFIIPI
jgi:hypothetical protein